MAIATNPRLFLTAASSLPGYLESAFKHTDSALVAALGLRSTRYSDPRPRDARRPGDSGRSSPAGITPGYSAAVQTGAIALDQLLGPALSAAEVDVGAALVHPHERLGRGAGVEPGGDQALGLLGADVGGRGLDEALDDRRPRARAPPRRRSRPPSPPAAGRRARRRPRPRPPARRGRARPAGPRRATSGRPSGRARRRPPRRRRAAGRACRGSGCRRRCARCPAARAISSTVRSRKGALSASSRAARRTSARTCSRRRRRPSRSVAARGAGGLSSSVGLATPPV